MKCFYRVADEHKELANATLHAACVRLAPQQWYNHKITAACHFWAGKGEKVSKSDLVGKNAKPEYAVMTAEDYMTVSEFTISLS
jgi:hypothetical protein